ncbi:MAG: glucose-6-phosphate isomerase [Rhizobacter sp.]|nr:glucose-6-phosphate isomerase [Rhizobacter sp.]
MSNTQTPSVTQCAAWKALAAHHLRVAGLQLRQLFADDPGRGERMALDAVGIYLDYSKNRITDETLRLLLALADETGLRGRIDAMLRGDKINVSEGRAVLHTALRAPRDAPIVVDGVNVVPAVHAVLDRMAAFAERVRSGAWKGHTGKRIRNVVNIGIGGSDLGPVMAYEALRHYSARDMAFRFVSNVDGTDFAEATHDLAAEETLFIVASKTFGTAETLRNATSARAWFEAQGGSDLAAHFVALTARPEAARAFGVGRCFAFDDGVGGRTSLWSVIGLPVAVAIGRAGFEALLAGAHAMDRHFAEAPLEANLPVQLGLLDVWYRNFHRFGSRCVVPYHHGLRSLAFYLQQLEMESNGKRVDAHGRPLPFDTAPVVWGAVGSNAQHAFFQMLHQGTQVVPVEFIAVREPAHTLEGHQPRLLANALAQARALMLGHVADDAHRHFPGNRPSTFLLLERLDAASFGALIALNEHRVFTSGSLWGLNSFDQWGVELGKRHAGAVETGLASGRTEGLDAATAGLVRRLR